MSTIPYKRIILLILALILLLVLPARAEAPTPVYVKPLTVEETIIKAAVKYALPEKKILWVAECESNFNVRAWNKNDPGVGSKGVFQFQESTFYGYAKELQITNPDIWNLEQQSEVAAYLFSKNKSSLWTCARKYDKIYIK